ncbi:MAG: acetyl-CoA hydrolase/transferase C-terminal domain-containing protein [Dehalococcoidia bacterium]
MRRNAQPQRVSARQAVRALPASGRVVFPHACGATLTLLDAIVDERQRFRALALTTGLIFVDHPVLQTLGENISLTTWHISGPVQKLADEGIVDFLPLRLSQVPHTFGVDGPMPADAVLIQVSPPDAHGYVSLGVSVSTMIDLARQAPLVIAEVNRQTPRTLGNSFLHLSEIDYLVDADYPVVQHRQARLGELERSIAQHVAGLIPDGATIQMGIGAIPEALMFLLDDKRDLGVHSGMISDGFVPLIEKGVINNARKPIDRYKVVTGEVMGSADLYAFVHDNPLVHTDSVSYTHNPLVIRQIDNFISINSAVEIDLGGQVNSESIGGRQISGLGGQFDYIEAALHSRGGVSIFAMPSTAAKGKHSRIVARLGHGAVVSTPRYCTDYVVTEYGVASLRGKTMRQRAEALTAIAHPDFRDELANCPSQG